MYRLLGYERHEDTARAREAFDRLGVRYNFYRVPELGIGQLPSFPMLFDGKGGEHWGLERIVAFTQHLDPEPLRMPPGPGPVATVQVQGGGEEIEIRIHLVGELPP